MYSSVVEEKETRAVRLDKGRVRPGVATLCPPCLPCLHARARAIPAVKILPCRSLPLSVPVQSLIFCSVMVSILDTCYS
ncbi:hypothetical protein BJV78DRAFT_174325 [Lactifluus subvellereus]|nr:hypothetical protein BJV78DRAFT_174325 [Lactifluus subvellereus]